MPRGPRNLQHTRLSVAYKQRLAAAWAELLAFAVPEGVHWGLSGPKEGQANQLLILWIQRLYDSGRQLADATLAALAMQRRLPRLL